MRGFSGHWCILGNSAVWPPCRINKAKHCLVKSGQLIESAVLLSCTIFLNKSDILEIIGQNQKSGDLHIFCVSVCAFLIFCFCFCSHNRFSSRHCKTKTNLWLFWFSVSQLQRQITLTYDIVNITCASCFLHSYYQPPAVSPLPSVWHFQDFAHVIARTSPRRSATAPQKKERKTIRIDVTQVHFFPQHPVWNATSQTVPECHGATRAQWV